MNMNTLAVAVGQAAPDAPSITVDGKDLAVIAVEMSESAARNHLRNLACDYCREQTVDRGLAGLSLYIGERPDVSMIPRTPVQTIHDANHKLWHKWLDSVKAAKQAVRARENKVYTELKAKGLRGLKLREEAEKVLAKLPKIVIPKLPQLADSHPKVERPVPVEAKAKKARGFRSQADEAKAIARAASVERTLQLLNKIGQEQGR